MGKKAQKLLATKIADTAMPEIKKQLSDIATEAYQEISDSIATKPAYATIRNFVDTNSITLKLMDKTFRRGRVLTSEKESISDLSMDYDVPGQNYKIYPGIKFIFKNSTTENIPDYLPGEVFIENVHMSKKLNDMFKSDNLTVDSLTTGFDCRQDNTHIYPEERQFCITAWLEITLDKSQIILY